MKITTEPRSDQWNADDFVGGPRTFTIDGAREGTAEQKYDIKLAEGEGRVWRPPLTVLRLLVAGWGDDASTWVGHRVTLVRDPSVRFGKEAVGGIRISHMSHLDKPLQVALTVSRGKRQMFTVQPLADAPPPRDYAAEVTAATDKDALRRIWNDAKADGALTDQLAAAITEAGNALDADTPDAPAEGGE